MADFPYRPEALSCLENSSRTSADLASSSEEASRQGSWDIRGKVPMLYTIVVVVLILWLLGLVTSYTMGGLIHILLVVAIVMLLVNFISGRGRA